MARGGETPWRRRVRAGVPLVVVLAGTAAAWGWWDERIEAHAGGALNILIREIQAILDRNTPTVSIELADEWVARFRSVSGVGR